MADKQGETPVSGTEQTLNPVGEKLGLLDQSALTRLLEKSPLFEPGEEPEPEAPEAAAEETPVEAEANKEPEKTEAEAAAEPAEETAEETDETDLSQDGAESNDEAEEGDDGLPKGVKKRFAQLTAKRREAEEKVARLEQQMAALAAEREEAKAEPVVPRADNPFSGIEKPEQLDAEAAKVRQIRRWCEEHPDGAVVKTASGDREYTAEEIRSIKLNVMDALEEHLPKQRAYLQARQQHDQTAEQIFPWWRDRTSTEYQTANQFLRQLPELKRFPDYKNVVGIYLEGIKAIQAKQAAAKKATAEAAKPKAKAPAPPPATAAPTAKAKDADKAKAVLGMFEKQRTQKDLADVLLARGIV